jgi:hypothetical protein
MTEQYLAILIDSLQKKIILLDEISELTELQSKVLADKSMDFQVFDAYVNDKDVLVKQLEKLDEGFDLVYRHVQKDLPQKKTQYANEIGILQDLISQIMDKSMDFQVFDAYVNDKDVLVKQLEKLDEGFDLVYRHVQKDLPQKKTQYANEIRILQDLISQIMDKSMSLQARESRNQQAVMQIFREEKTKLGSHRRSNQAAMNYYRNSSGLVALAPQFLDQKK